MGVYRGYGSGPAAGQTYEEWLRAFSETFLGSSALPPTVDLYGNPIQYGAMYFDTDDEVVYVYTSTGWVAVGDNTTTVPPSPAPPQSHQNSVGMSDSVGLHFSNYRDGHAGGSGTSFNVGYTYYIPFICPPFAGTVVNTKIKAASWASLTNFKLAIYRDRAPCPAAGRAPGTKITDGTSSGSPYTNHVLTPITTDWDFTAGELIWFGFQIDNAGASVYSFGSAGNINIYADPTSTVRMNSIGWEKVESYGTAFGNDPTLTAPAVLNSVPAIFCELG